MSPAPLDAPEFWRLFREDRGALYLRLGAQYPQMPLHYVMYFVDCFADLEGNPNALTYVDADLGAAARADTLLAMLGGTVPVRGARVLDIGCSNGALLRAAALGGARQCVGLDVDPRRLISARKVCAGLPVEFCEMDAARTPLAGAFDVVFCLDVLEHVDDWAQLLAHALHALAPGGRLFLSLHNARHPATVLAEPHYDIPALVLLDPPAARACWMRIRTAVQSTVDYEVTTWPLYPALRDALVAHGLQVEPYVDCAPAFSADFWAGEPPRALATLPAEADAALRARGIPEPDAAQLRAAIEAYTIDARAAFRQAATGPPAQRLEWFVTYQAQPLNLLGRRAGP